MPNPPIPVGMILQQQSQRPRSSSLPFSGQDLPQQMVAELLKEASDSATAAQTTLQAMQTLLVTSQGVQLKAWAAVQAFTVTSATRNADGAITTASIIWPDGVAGVYTADVLSTTFPGATDAWHATYVGSPVKTITQTSVTRDSNGGVIAQPAITIG